MKCEECLQVIEEYFDGELDTGVAARISAHLAKCENCARELEALRDEQNLYALYRRDVEVTPQLWTSVASRIREEKAAHASSPANRWRERLASLFGTPRLSPAFAFALLILAVGATAGLMKYMQSHQSSDNQQAISQKQPQQVSTSKEKSNAVNSSNDKEKAANEDDNEQLTPREGKMEDRAPKVLNAADRVESRRQVVRPLGIADEETPDELVREAEQKYRAAIALLSRDARRRRTLLEPDVQARFDQTLASVDQTINETRRAVRRQPDDPVAVQYMLAAYAKKVEVLREMATYRADDRGVQ